MFSTEAADEFVVTFSFCDNVFFSVCSVLFLGMYGINTMTRIMLIKEPAAASKAGRCSLRLEKSQN